ncbi:MAG: cysteine desulfurase [Sphingobacteriia bacterium]|nr:cysteine desulfurase [Sphingobacteriia bacterium]
MQYSVDKIRADFPILKQMIRKYPLVYFDNGATTQKPVKVIEAVDRYYLTINSNIHRGVHYLSNEATDAFEQARKRVATFINAPESREVIFTKGTTESINLVANSLAGFLLKEGDEVMVTEMEHHANIVPWQMVCERVGAKLKVVPISDSGELLVESLDSLLTERVKIIAFAHVSNVLGTINPVQEICAKAHERGILTLVDGAQGIAHQTVDVQSLGCDFYVFSGHKMYAPMGTGVLWGKASLLESMPPYQGGGEMIDKVSFTGTTYNVIPYKFEAGTPDVGGVIGLMAAIDYLTEIDFGSALEYEEGVMHYAYESLKQIEGLRFIGDAKRRTGVISFILNGAHPYDVGSILDHQGIAVRTGHHCAQPLMDRFAIPGTVRASFSIYNTREEVDKLVAGLKVAANMLL